MSEATMLELVREGVRALGIDDDVTVAGQFSPRGHTGAMFLGGLAGDEVGGRLGEVGDAIGVVGGAVAGAHAADAASGLPAEMLVGVSASSVYGFAASTRHTAPTALVFRVAREGLTVQVHQRANVRILELIHEDSGSRIELEGNRLPMTHAHDVIEALRS